jgi:hypothetical protein
MIYDNHYDNDEDYNDDHNKNSNDDEDDDDDDDDDFGRNVLGSFNQHKNREEFNRQKERYSTTRIELFFSWF